MIRSVPLARAPWLPLAVVCAGMALVGVVVPVATWLWRRAEPPRVG